MITWNHDHEGIKFWQEQNTYHLDVRPFLEKGGEPYQMIMDCVGQLAPSDTLLIHALFDPKPLRVVLSQMGLQAEVERKDKEHWVLMVRSNSHSS